jgi:hypothetical protein
MLVNQTPGGLHGRFFEEVGEPATDKSRPSTSEGPPDIERMLAIAATYGIEVPLPLGR